MNVKEVSVCPNCGQEANPEDLDTCYKCGECGILYDNKQEAEECCQEEEEES